MTFDDRQRPRLNGHPYRPLSPSQLPLESAGADGRDRVSPWLEERLFDQRIVMLDGPLTSSAASQTAAALLMLDSLNADPVRLNVSARDGELAAAFALVDAIATMRAPLHLTVITEVGGAALAVLAVAGRRLAYRHARIRLAEPRATVEPGTTNEVTAAAGQYLRELEELVLRLAEVTGQPRSQVENDLSVGRTLTAEEARECGLIDEIVGPYRERPSARG